MFSDQTSDPMSQVQKSLTQIQYWQNVQVRPHFRMLDFLQHIWQKTLPIFQLWFCILGNHVLSVRWPAMCFKHWKGWSLRTWWSSSASMLLPMTSPGPLRPWLCPRCFTFIQIVAVAHHQSQKLSKTRVWKFKTWYSKLKYGQNKSRLTLFLIPQKCLLLE